MSTPKASTNGFHLSLLDNLDAIVIAVNARQRIVFANAFARQVLGKELHVFLRSRRQDTIKLFGEDLEPLTDRSLPLKQVLRGEEVLNRRGFLVSQSPHRQVLVSMSGKPLPDRGGMIVAHKLLESEFASLWQPNQPMDYFLPPRHLFTSWLRAALASYQENPSQAMAVCHIDIFRLGWVNLQRGHAVGNELLNAFCQRLVEQLHSHEMMAHTGSGKFGMLLTEATTVDELLVRAERLFDRVSQPFHIQNRPISIASHMGVALASTEYQHVEDWLQDAVLAANTAKTSTEHGFQVFGSTLKAQRERELHMAASLEEALEKNQLRIHYQAIVAVPGKNVLGLEALLRWQHPEYGLLLPGDFLAIAEETNLIIPIGWWILSEACRQMKAWFQRFPICRKLKLSINMSSKQFAQRDLLTQIQTVLNETSFPAEQLVLEITESDLMENSETIISALQSLKSLGIKMSIDDFGTGYSSLGYLHTFPIDSLKIDRSFLSNIDNNYEKLSILQSVVKLAWNLGLDVVAEGIETPQHFHQVNALRCESGQGFLFSRPLSSEEIHNFIASESIKAAPENS